MRPYIIAEIGFNHEGDPDEARAMIRAAARAGADAVKFQTYRAIDLALPSSPHFELIKTGEMDLEMHRALAQEAGEAGVDFLSTPFSRWAVDLLEEVGVKSYKVASMDSTNKYLLRYIAQTGKPIFMSTGMASLDEMAEMLPFLSSQGAGPVSLLHCLALYPAPASALNLEIIPLLAEMFDVPIGYSDHYPGIDACLAAAMMGAEVIETHFTLDTTREGGDHFHSVDPDMLRRLVDQIALFTEMRGTTAAIHDRPDRDMAAQFRRGVYTARDLTAGEEIGADDLLFCRPASSLTPNDYWQINGRRVKADIAAHQELTADLLD